MAIKQIKNKIINLDFLKSESKSELDDHINLIYQSSIYNYAEYDCYNVHFDNCIFIVNNSIHFNFEACELANCTFYYPNTINSTNSSIINVSIISNMHDLITICFRNTYTHKVIFDSCLFYTFISTSIITEYLPDKIQFINCENEPGFYINEKSFYGYKYSREGYLIVLEILKNAGIYESNCFGKCRCDKVKVVSILNTNGTYSGVKECRSWYDEDFKYELDDTIMIGAPLAYTPCAEGIHFFKSLEKAYDFYCDEMYCGRI